MNAIQGLGKSTEVLSEGESNVPALETKPQDFLKYNCDAHFILVLFVCNRSRQVVLIVIEPTRAVTDLGSRGCTGIFA
jgi:hypothetical protein